MPPFFGMLVVSASWFPGGSRKLFPADMLVDWVEGLEFSFPLWVICRFLSPLIFQGVYWMFDRDPYDGF